MITKVMSVYGTKSGKRGKTIYAWIHFRGVWLNLLGWRKGDQIRVEADDKKIIVTKL